MLAQAKKERLAFLENETIVEQTKSLLSKLSDEEVDILYKRYNFLYPEIDGKRLYQLLVCNIVYMCVRHCISVEYCLNKIIKIAEKRGNWDRNTGWED